MSTSLRILYANSSKEAALRNWHMHINSLESDTITGK